MCFGSKRGADMGPDAPRMRKMHEQGAMLDFGFPQSSMGRGRRPQRRSSMTSQPGQPQRRPNLSDVFDFQQQNGPQGRRSSNAGFAESANGPRRRSSSRGRLRAPSRPAGPEPGFFGHPMQHQEGFLVREVVPQRRSSMIRPGERSRSKMAQFQSERGQQRQASAPPQGPFPFTVFGKGRGAKPDPTARRRNFFGMRGGRSERDGQHVGNNIMKKYIVMSALKKGGMAEAVNIIREKSTGYQFVQKCIPLRRSFDYKRARAEINALLKIDAHGRHDNLNAIIESEISEARQQCFIILEYCEMGSVQDSITAFERQRGHPRESAAWNIMAGVSNGLAFLHHGFMNGRQVSGNWDPICHLDIKPCNIFVSSRGGKHGHGRIVLADFGCAITQSDVQRQIEDPFVQQCGTPAWYPPEGRVGGRVMGAHYGPKTDIWQLGATVHVFCKLLHEPDRRYLALPRPCSGRYSDRLNRVVAQLCHSQSTCRPNAPRIAREATDGFEQAARGSQRW